MNEPPPTPPTPPPPPPCRPAPTFSTPRSLPGLVQAFKWRARTKVFSAAQDLAAKSATLPFDDAWNACAVALVDAARAHCYFVMLARWGNAVHVFVYVFPLD